MCIYPWSVKLIFQILLLLFDGYFPCLVSLWLLLLIQVILIILQRFRVDAVSQIMEIVLKDKRLVLVVFTIRWNLVFITMIWVNNAVSLDIFFLCLLFITENRWMVPGILFLTSLFIIFLLVIITKSAYWHSLFLLLTATKITVVVVRKSLNYTVGLTRIIT